MNLLVLAAVVQLVLLSARAQTYDSVVVECGDENEWRNPNDGNGALSVLWVETKDTLSYFPVSGVNLALYGRGQKTHGVPDHGPSPEEAFQLFEDFHTGETKVAAERDAEEWYQFLRSFKRNRDDPSLIFYDDKVAVKRWLPSRGVDIPRIMLLSHVSDLMQERGLHESEDGVDVQELANAILQLMPTNETDFVAKPSNKERSAGVWVVSHDREKAVTRISQDAKEDLEVFPDFQLSMLTKSLAEEIVKDIGGWAGMPQKGAKAGIVVEERFTGFDFDVGLEFKCFIIWGRLYVANWRLGGWRGLWWPGVVKRDGSMAEGSEMKEIPTWVDWSQVVDIAERVGAHKDFFRVDLFVGVSAGSPALREGASETERRAAVRYVVSEMSSTSSEPLPTPVLNEMMRLWVAGYKIGNYQVIPNTEVPSDFLIGHQN